MNEENLLDRAIKFLGFYRAFKTPEHQFTIACLIRLSDQRPLKAPWWRGKEVYLLGADLNGNFFLLHCDGSVRYWNHAARTDTVVARSLREFLAKIVDDEDEPSAAE